MNRAARFACRLLCAGLAVAVVGCGDPAKKVTNRYSLLPTKKVPDYLHDTIFQYTDLAAIEPFPVSGYGLVANLQDTGGSRAPTPVRDYMIKEMTRRGFGGLVTGLASPESILNNKSFALVRVDGYIPPGARAGADWSNWFDVRVSALPESDTTSLAHGDLYECDLKTDGANPRDPGSGHVAVMAQARGSVFVNPAYALDDSVDSVAAKRGRRNGVVLGGARVISDRPLLLRLRAPERRMARAIENRINERFQDVVDEDLKVKHVAAAVDEGTLDVYVPRVYSNDWQHFAGVMQYLYMNGASPEYAAVMAQKLADAAVTPNAPLLEISYAFEGLGKPALHALRPLLDSDKPDIRYAAARAAAFIGDAQGASTLVAIAASSESPFRVNAVHDAGELPQSPLVDAMLRRLLASDQALVRIEAYTVLARHHDQSIYTHVVKHGDDEKFVLDMVPSAGPPMIWASRQDLPRLAIFGTQTSIDLPISFTTLEDRLSIASVSPDSPVLTIFYRRPGNDKPIKIFCTPDLAQVASRLGGEGDAGSPRLNFSYADVVAIVQAMVDGGKVSGLEKDQRQLASFVLQELPKYEELVDTDTAPLLRDTGRPTAARPTSTGRPNTIGSTQTPAADSGLLK